MLQGQVAPLETDRPDFTESASAVPLGLVQVEAGATWTHPERRFTVFSGPEVLFRVGVAERFELRLGLPNYAFVDVDGARSEGFDDTYVGAKIQLGPLGDGMGLALIPGVFLPTGRAGFRSDEAIPTVQLVWSRDLAGDTKLAGLLQVSSEEADGRRTTPVTYTLVYSFPLGDRLGSFVEHVLEARRGSAPAHLLHTGLTFAAGDTAQWDLHFGFGLTRDAPDFFVGFGYSVRF